MPLDYASIVTRRSRTAFGGAMHPAGKIGSGVSHDETIRLLQNWSRWAAAWFPELGVQAPPIFEMWRPYNDPEFKLWGDAIPEQVPAVDEREAERIDKLLCPTAERLHKDHLATLKRHYINFRRQPRDRHDAAVRALGDILG